MSRPKRFVRCLGAVILAASVFACQRGLVDVAAQYDATFAPFDAARDAAVSDVANAKSRLSGAQLSRLTAAYTNLQSTANGFVDYLAGATQTASFDKDVDAKQASALSSAIAAFDAALQEIVGSGAVSTDWIGAFGNALAKDWDAYKPDLQRAPQSTRDAWAARVKQHEWPPSDAVQAKERLRSAP